MYNTTTNNKNRERHEMFFKVHELQFTLSHVRQDFTSELVMNTEAESLEEVEADTSCIRCHCH